MKREIERTKIDPELNLSLSKRAAKSSPAWAAVRQAREALDNAEGADEYAELESLLDCWNLIDSAINAGPARDDGFQYRMVDRDRLLLLGDNPLEAITACVNRGMYPPPELLLGLSLCWMEYLDASGEKTLEEVFIGKPKRKAGNYASRDQTKHTRMRLAWEFLRLVEGGMTQERAAELIVNKHGLRVDAESFARQARQDGMVKLVLRNRKKKRLINPSKRK
jgi:hypothetical protein